MNYELKNQQLKVQFTTTGGSLTSIKDIEGLEYLWQGDANFWSGQAPVLFPICGSLREDKAVLKNGKITEMPRHGIVRKKEFELKKLSNDSICFYFDSDLDTKKAFPYDFRLSIEYKLLEDGVSVTYQIHNKSTKTMPFSVGGHPGFRCPLQEGEDYSDYLLEFEKEEYCSVPTPVTATGLIDMEHRNLFLDHQKTIGLSHEMFEVDAVILDELQSRKVKVYHKDSGKGVAVEFEDFPYLILWSTQNHGPFIAIEPWSGLSTCSDEDDNFEQKRNMLFAEPEEIKELTFTIRVL